MSSASELRKFMDATGELPREILLGHVAWFSVSDADYVLKDIEEWFDELGLNTDFLPLMPKPVDAYRRATSEADETSYPLEVGHATMTATILVRDVAKDNQMVVRQAVRELRDSQRRRLAFNPVADLVFYRPSTRGGRVDPDSARVRFTLLEPNLMPNERALATGVLNDMAARYHRYIQHIDGMKVRAMIRNYLLFLNAVQIKPSVYFVHVSRDAELVKLQELMNRLGKVASGTSLHTMPLPDLDNQREMVINAFQTEAVDSLNGLVREIQELRENRKRITPDAYAKLKGKYDDVMSRAMEYTRTLGISQDNTATAAEVALETLVALQAQMLKDAT